MMNGVLPLGANQSSANSNPTGIAVIGCGYWGMNYVRIFNELTESRVAAVCEQSPERLKEVARRFPNVYLTTQIDDVLSQPDVHAVVVCTEASSHYNVARRLLSAGKHLLVEKPLTTTSRDAENLIELADSHSVTLMVGHTFIFNAGIRKVKEYVKQDTGRVYYLYARRTNLGPIRRDVNALWDLAPHDIAIFNYLLDATPEWVSAVGGKVLGNSRDDVGFVSLGYPGNVLAHVHVSWADPDKAREVVVVKSDRRILFNDLNGVEQVRVFEKGVSCVEEEPLKSQCRHFLECVRTGKRPVSSGVAGRDVVRVLEGINRSMECKGLQVSVEDKADYVHPNVEAAEAPECSLR